MEERDEGGAMGGGGVGGQAAFNSNATGDPLSLSRLPQGRMCFSYFD